MNVRKQPSRKKSAPPPKSEEAQIDDDDILTKMLGEATLDGRDSSDMGDIDPELWVKSRGWSPLEMLTHTYRNPWVKMPDRISAAKAVLEYVHRKLPQKLEVDATLAGRNISLDATALTKLSDKELATLESILSKVG